MDLKGIYTADANRYGDAEALYKRCGKSGVLLPKVSLGFWHNFGGVDPYERSRAITHYAFDHGITHFDLANNYGPPYGSAEETMGRLMKDDFQPYRDELFISTKAGYDMWEGPYGNWGSRKYLMASLDQSLKRMNLDYVDLFYSHRYDPFPHIISRLGRDEEFVTIRQESILHQSAHGFLSASVRRTIVVGKVEVGDSVVEGIVGDGTASFVRIHSSEVVPESQTNLRQQDSALAASLIKCLCVAIAIGIGCVDSF